MRREVMFTESEGFLTKGGEEGYSREYRGQLLERWLDETNREMATAMKSVKGKKSRSNRERSHPNNS